MKLKLIFSAAVCSLLLSFGSAAAQTPSPAPELDEGEMRELIRDAIEESRDVSDRVQYEVNETFGLTMTLLNILIGFAAILIPFTGIFIFMVRQQIVAQIIGNIADRELKDEINKLKEEYSLNLKNSQDKLDKDKELEIETFRKELNDCIDKLKGKQAEIEKDFRVQADVLKNELEEQVITLLTELVSSTNSSESDKSKTLVPVKVLALQQRKNRIFKKLSRLTSAVLDDSLDTKTKQEIRNLTDQLDSIKTESPELFMTASEYLNQGDAFYAEERYQEALESYEKAIERQEDLFCAWIGKAKALRKLAHYEEAIEANKQVIALKPNSYQGWFGKGFVFENQKRYQEALVEYNKAIELSPKSAFIWRHLGYVRTKLEDYDKARSDLNKAQELKRKSSSVLYARAYYELTRGQIDSAIDLLQRAIAMKESHRKILKDDPDFDTIRQDDRFQKLVKAD